MYTSFIQCFVFRFVPCGADLDDINGKTMDEIEEDVADQEVLFHQAVHYL
jgi:hypothetical protein